MTDDETRIARVKQRAWEMKDLREGERVQLVDEAPNCLGYDRFMLRQKQVSLRDAYRKPATSGPGGHA